VTPPTAAPQLPGAAFNNANVFASLLTLEGLAFAVITTALALAAPSARSRKAVVGPVAMARLAASLVTLLGLACALCWFDIFLDDFPSGPLGAVGAIAILIAIFAQAAFAWVVASAAGFED
jgi:drug/metabolite transporter (DMT)-like permease